MNKNTQKIEKRFASEIASLLKELKSQIDDEMRCSDEFDVPDDNLPSLLVTVSTNDDMSHWNYQTGDNSYSGSCYGDPHWSVI